MSYFMGPLKYRQKVPYPENYQFFLQTKKLNMQIHNFNALVICNHVPPQAQGIAGTLTFSLDSKSLLKAPPCGDCSLVKPLFPPPLPQPAIFLFHGPFCMYKAIPGYCCNVVCLVCRLLLYTLNLYLVEASRMATFLGKS